MQAPTVDEKEVLAGFKRHDSDAAWFKERKAALLTQYAGQFIAIYDRRIVGVGEALQDALRSAEAAGIDPRKCLIELIATEDWISIL